MNSVDRWRKMASPLWMKALQEEKYVCHQTKPAEAKVSRKVG